jgi:hypothetical protein
MADDERQHAVMIIDMPNASAEEIQTVFRSVRECAAQTEAPGWPEDLAVLVGDAAVDISERVRLAVAANRYTLMA